MKIGELVRGIDGRVGRVIERREDQCLVRYDHDSDSDEWTVAASLLFHPEDPKEVGTKAQRFTESIWETYPSCEFFSRGDEPRFRDLADNVLAIADFAGVAILFQNDERCEQDAWLKAKEGGQTLQEGEEILNALPEVVDAAWCKENGYVLVYEGIEKCADEPEQPRDGSLSVVVTKLNYVKLLAGEWVAMFNQIEPDEEPIVITAGDLPGGNYRVTAKYASGKPITTEDWLAAISVLEDLM